MQSLAVNIRKYRIKVGLSQEQLAEAAGLHVKHIQRLETGITNTTLATVAAIAYALGIRPEVLIKTK